MIRLYKVNFVCYTSTLEALAMNNGWSRFIIFLLGYPHLLEGGERGKDGATDPYRVFPLGRSNDLDLHCGWSQGCDLLLHTVGDARVHCATTGEDSVAIEILTDVNITLHDGVVGGLMDTSRLHTQEAGLEESLGASETLVADGDDLSVRKLVALLDGGAGGSCAHLLLEVQGNIAEFLLDVTDNFTLGSGGERVSTLCEDLHEVICQVTTSQIQTEDGMGEGVSLVDGNSVRNTITRVKHDPGGTSRGIEREHSLDGNVHSWSVEGLEHDLGHLLTVSLGVEGGLSQKYRVLFWGNTQLIVEGVMPDLRRNRICVWSINSGLRQEMVDPIKINY